MSKGEKYEGRNLCGICFVCSLWWLMSRMLIQKFTNSTGDGVDEEQYGVRSAWMIVLGVCKVPSKGKIFVLGVYGFGDGML